MSGSDDPIWRQRPRGSVIGATTAALAGLEQLRALTGTPPLQQLTGTSLDSASLGRAVFSMPTSGWLLAPQGVIPGGVLAVPADGALGCAIHTLLPAGTTYTTAELSLTYLRPIPRQGLVRATGQPIHIGRTLALSSCEVTDARGRLIAHGTSRCLVFRTPEGSPRSGGSATPRELSTDGIPAADPRPPFERPPRGQALPPGKWQRRSGLELLRAWIDGIVEAPPLQHLFGIAPVAVDEGSAACVMPATGWLATPWGWPQGGFVAMLADIAMGMAVQTTVPAGVAQASVDLKVNYLRPVTPDGSLLTAAATVIHRGRSLVVAQTRVTDTAGRVVAVATGSSQLLANRDADLGARA